MIDVLLRTALTGSAVTLSWLAVNALLGKRLPALWHYRVLKLALFLFLVPVWALAALAAKLTANLAPAAPVTAPELTPAPQIPVTVLPVAPVSPAAPLPEAAPVALSVDLFQVLTAVWAIGAAAVLGYKLWVYIRFRRSVLRQNRAVSDPETREVFAACKAQLGLRREVALRQNPLVPTPLSTGLLRPVVVLPTLSLSREELRYLFLHELTHIKRHDLWVRFFSMLAAALHWYDPLVYVLNKQIKNLSEQSCDERVSAPLDRGERFAYGSVLLKLAADTVAGPCEWAVSLSAKDTIERRLIRVLHSEKLKGRKRLLAFALAAAILACGTAAALAARSPLVQREDEPPTQNIQDENAALRETLAKYEEQKETDTAVWFTPADIHDIETAELVWWDGTVYTLKDPSAPDVLESLLNGASAVTPSGCPFHSMLYLRRSDGVTGKVLPAEDSCDILQSDGAYYSLGMGNNESFYALFGVNTNELPQYTNVAAQKPEETDAENADAAQSGKTAAVLYPDALRGDTVLILSRGGTLLPDDDPRSYVSSYSTDGTEIYYKQFIGKDGRRHEEYLVGNREALLAEETLTHAEGAEERVDRWLSTLVNGEYPKNKNGESYGIDGLENYVGYAPDLFGVKNPETGLSGYVRRTDEPGYDVRTLEDTVAYMEWRKVNPGPYQLPMYDAKGDQIGYWEMGGSDDSVDTTGMTIEEAKEAVAEAGLAENPGKEIDTTGMSVEEAKAALDNGYQGSGPVKDTQELMDRLREENLVDGQYPTTTDGKTYGPIGLIPHVHPDLVSVIAANGKSGYAKYEEFDPYGTLLSDPDTTPEELAAAKALLNDCVRTMIPVYDLEGNVVGEYETYAFPS